MFQVDNQGLTLGCFMSLLKYERIQSSCIVNKRQMTYDTLTKREKEVSQYASHGLSAKVIAQKLSISPRTAEYHLNNLKNKFHVQTKQQLIQVLNAD